MAKWERNSSIPMDISVNTDMLFNTIVNKYDDNMREQRKRKSLYPRRNITVGYTYITKAQARTFWQFYQQRFGRYETFYFVIPYIDTYVGEYVGVGDDVTTNYNLPTENIASYTVYLDGSAESEGPSGVGSYTISGAGGTDSNDLLIWNSPPSSGQKITIDFTGYLVVLVRFEDDIQSFERFNDKFSSMGISLHGLLWDEENVVV